MPVAYFSIRDCFVPRKDARDRNKYVFASDSEAIPNMLVTYFLYGIASYAMTRCKSIA
ncbi:MAG: hypothetical protein JWR05_1604 [Mucilaginibacter sp.]|nr:hypothetical protein [Mucilaginibacter sp.]